MSEIPIISDQNKKLEDNPEEPEKPNNINDILNFISNLFVLT